jgi:hypothetical protein
MPWLIYTEHWVAVGINVFVKKNENPFYKNVRWVFIFQQQ